MSNPTEEQVEAAAKALRDDQERIAAILQLRHPGNMYSTCERDADAILAAGFSRATVPDAATERARQAEAELRDMLRVDIPSLKAERDAALAAVEQIREAVSGHPECDRYSEDDVISCGWKSAYASVVAALDGAPEPEWEYACREVDELEPWSCSYESRKALKNSLAGLAVRDDEEVVRRRKAGPWLPVEGESK